jgi:peptidylprolyl isomerase
LHTRTAFAALLAFALIGCEGGNTTLSIEETTYAASLGVDLANSTKLASGLYYRDMVVGGGATVANGMQLTMHYTGFLTNGSVFDANTAGEVPLAFTLGAGQVIDGWDQGIVGMKVGGKRQLIIPPSLGYGEAGSGPIPGNAILVFSVDVVTAN